jgi:Ca2+/Na+ antiporter
MFSIIKIFFTAFTIFLIIYFLVDFPGKPLWGEYIFIIWYFLSILLFYLGIKKKTKLEKNSKTGHWEEVTIEKSIVEQETEIHNLEIAARKQEKLRQKHLSQTKQDQINEKQRSDKQKVMDENIDGTGLMDKVRRLKKLYINGTLTKDEFEKAKNKLLK